MSQTIGILGGSFNPVHIGHIIVASYVKEFMGLDEVWLTLSPLNPLKSHPDELIPDLERLAMLRIAVEGYPGLGVCDLELSLPTPSYTINTLRALSRRYPRKQFKLIIGSDNWKIFQQWRSYQEIVDDYGVIVYPRPGYEIGPIYEDNVTIAESPLTSLNSTFIRRAISQGYDMNAFLPHGVYQYIQEHNLYQSKKS